MSEYCVVVAVSNPATVDALTRMGCTLSQANDGVVKVVSVAELSDQLPAAADGIGHKQEAIVERALSVSESFDVPVEGLSPASHDLVESVVTLTERVDASALVMGSNELSPFKKSLLGRTFVETVGDRVACDIYVERVGPGPAIPGESILVPIAAGVHADAAVRVASDIGAVHGMDVNLVTVLSEEADM